MFEKASVFRLPNDTEDVVEQFEVIVGKGVIKEWHPGYVAGLMASRFVTPHGDVRIRVREPGQTWRSLLEAHHREASSGFGRGRYQRPKKPEKPKKPKRVSLEAQLRADAWLRQHARSVGDDSFLERNPCPKRARVSKADQTLLDNPNHWYPKASASSIDPEDRYCQVRWPEWW